MTEAADHVNVLINSSIENDVTHNDVTMEDEQLLNVNVTTQDHINVLINSSIENAEGDNIVTSEDAKLLNVDVTTDDEKLLNRSPYKPRNNFPSYSNDVQNVTFRRQSRVHATFNNLIESVTNRQSNRLSTSAIQPGATNFLSTHYESLDYDICQNNLLQDEERTKGYKFIVRKNFARWFIFLLIGILTALIACFVDISIEQLSELKYGVLTTMVDECVANNCLWLPYIVWVCLNMGPVLIGALLVTYVEPVASGSGIPQVKCYLNGIKVPRVVRVKTLVVKILGVISTVVGGLAGGKEGPMIHAGAVVAAGISQGKSTTFNNWDLGIFKYFREDHEKRDFVSGGAAAGVSAAFGAPIGGVLFSIEEGTSFFNQSLTWRTFLASMISTFTLNIVLSAYHGHPGELSYPGLLNLGKFETIPYEVYEIPLFMIVGTMGGLFGALWNHLNYKITCLRMKYIRKKWLKVVEALSVAAMAATMGSLMIFFSNDCQPLGDGVPKFPKLFCAEGEYSAVAALWFQTPERTVRSLFHDPKGSHNDITLVIFVILYFFLAASTFGLSMSSGLFIPSLLIGSAWGRLFGSAITKIAPSCTFFVPGKYALLGAAAQLGGVVRMTISLTAILIEATQGISFGLPVIIVLIMAKWVGDFFNEGIYDIHTRMAGAPLLPWEPPDLSNNIYASEIMSHPIVTLKTTENVGHIVELLKCVTFNGFPVVDPPTGDGNEIKSYGRFRGLILRSQLIVLIKNKIFHASGDDMDSTQSWNDVEFTIETFRNEYPRYPTIDQIEVTDLEKTYTVELRPFMNSSPYTVQHSATLPRVFRLFRALGLRHLPVVNDVNEVIGMITRKDVARYRIWKHRGKMGLDELLITNKLS